LKKLKKNAELDWNHLKSGATAICGLEGEVWVLNHTVYTRIYRVGAG
jgi:hypothetical protein